MSKITNDDLTRSGTGCFIDRPYGIWASKGLIELEFYKVTAEDEFYRSVSYHGAGLYGSSRVELAIECVKLMLLT